jgi:hypothetical protein
VPQVPGQVSRGIQEPCRVTLPLRQDLFLPRVKLSFC